MEHFYSFLKDSQFPSSKMGRRQLDLVLFPTSHNFPVLRRGEHLCHVPWDFLESVRPHQRRIHHPDFNYLLWMEEARRTGKCCSLWKVLIGTSVPEHLQWRRHHIISKVTTLLHHLLGIKDLLHLLFSAAFWWFSSIFIHPGKSSSQQHRSEVTIAQFW